ncbi:protein phosphatase 2C domain-containing protein [uncultured Enorma sp.]|uniref:protein phosphatase 2C domain-containing protein n=1 Tax=uncultured Enorma sp. TaxID=1714346 RepID=UPI002597E125|nr:protein phosphatase 2C domain-containing protein [uncultured Enorma sp.]
MIKRFWYCARGIDHVRTNDPCQDAYLSVRHGKNMVFGIGDGPGSRPHSERGSRRAVASAVLYTANHLSDDLAPRDVEEVLRRAFLVSYHEVCELARQAGEDVSELDTTLCLGVWDGNRLSFGQAGDSGMVAALADGTYVAVTRQQRTADGYLIPLRFGPDTWEFGTVEADVAAVLVATDGLLERVCPRLLADTDKPVYVPLAQILMHHTEKDVEELRTARHAWRAFVREDPRMHTTDDATMLVFFDPEHPPALRDESYYEEPDWETLRRELRERVMRRWMGEAVAAPARDEPDAAGTACALPDDPGAALADESGVVPTAEKASAALCAPTSAPRCAQDAEKDSAEAR